MRLYEFVDSDQQVLSIIKPLLLRAKAEGADSIPVNQLINDINDSSITPELLINILNKHRKDLSNIITTATYDDIVLNKNEIKSMTNKLDKDVNKMKNTALKQAMDKLK
jgi:hypothetical protein